MEKEETVNEEFNIPFYIFDEIIEYFELTEQGKKNPVKWANVEALMGCARINKRLTMKQIEEIRKRCCREM